MSNALFDDNGNNDDISVIGGLGVISYNGDIGDVPAASTISATSATSATCC